MADHRSIGESSPAVARPRPTPKTPPRSPLTNTLQPGTQFISGQFISGKRGSFARAVGSFVPRLTQKAMEKYGFSTAALLTDWAAIVGDDLARHSTPLRLKWPRTPDTYGETPADDCGRPGATLHLQVEAHKALDVQYKSRQIVERINSYFGYRAVAELRIVQAPIAPLKPSHRDLVTTGPRPAPGPAPDLSSVTDERLRAALERLQLGLARR